jgi:tetratricopeptide (TPR) repeat protein
MLLLASSRCWAQAGSGGVDTLGSSLKSIETKTWQVFGRVTDVRGVPLGGALVRVNIGTGSDPLRVLKTNLQGEFQTQYTLESNMFTNVRLTVVVNKTGYSEARERAEFSQSDRSSGIEIVLRKAGDDADQLSLATLRDALAPRLQQDAAKRLGADAQRKEFVQGCEDLITRHRAGAAVPLLTKVVERTPACVECRLLLSFALLEGGSWAGGRRQLEEADKLNDASTAKRPEPPLIAGLMIAWRGDASQSAPYFQKALEIDPHHPLALQEMGRALIEQKNWGAAEQVLDRALAAGAAPEARLLRIRALLELGDIQEAVREMDLYVGGRDPKNLPSEARAIYVQVQDRVQLAPFAQVQSVTSQSPQELIAAMPELRGLQAATSQEELELILTRTGEGVEAFVKNFPNTVSHEQVHQERLGKDGKVRDSLDQEFQYLLLARPEKWGLGLDEHRANIQGQASSLQGYNQGLMLTSGFTSASWVFHPANQSGTSFRYLGRQAVEGKELHVVAFAQKPETSRMIGRFISDQGSALILVQGLAWIDPASFQIVRLRTDLLNPLAKVRLQRQTTEIQFHQVTFKEVATALWLPREVAVTVDWRGRIYRNSHRYSDFKLFNVEAKEEIRAPTISAPPPETDGRAK